ncbi:MAG: alpha-glucan family phosphorylase [Candidatus Woesearchaeota archaeon]|jgi:starch phosphorylase|nr:alpha-glucan family phosphorylase [Candidatus Woesearchaeota archaeon]
MSNIKIAYFSAEIGISEKIKTYSGGLGILAGGTIKAMADLRVPFCAVTLLYKDGYFKQHINEETNLQEELDDKWDYEKILEDTGKKVKVNISGEDVWIKIWKYEYEGVTGHRVPIYFLDTKVEGNSDSAVHLTNHLYVGDRIGQEIVLGIGGFRALKELEYNEIQKYHMNEGHSAFLTLELYKTIGESIGWDDGEVREKCVFTTHTPIAAGHDKFSYEEFDDKLRGEQNIVPLHIRKLAGEYELNTTTLAMSFSSHINAVSRKHGEVTRDMFPDFSIEYITNGVHGQTWISSYMKSVFDNSIPGWKEDFTKLKEVFKIPNSEIYKAHSLAKKDLIKFVNENNVAGSVLKEDVLTIGFARRFIAYKDAELIFSNIDNLKRLGEKVQFIFSGKSHVKDGLGKDIMRRIIEKAKLLKGDISIAFVENYNMEVAKLLVAGCDMWLNTPIPFNEASGTSGMKAVMNGCLHFSRLDGWAIEAYEMNGGGFPISEYPDFMTTLEYKVIPMFYSQNKAEWVEEMKLSIGNSGGYFNTHRMAREYIKKAYRLKL